MSHEHRVYRAAIEALQYLQGKLEQRPNRLQVDVLATSLVEENGLMHDPRKDYFLKLAKCALLGRESMYPYPKKLRRTK